MKIIPEISLDLNWKKTGLINLKTLNKYTTSVVTAVLRHLNFRCNEFTISMFFTTNKKIQNLNMEFRKKNYPTNVLSFNYCEDENILEKSDHYKDKKLYIGELVFGYETILKEASELCYPMDCSPSIFKNHLTHLIIHGTLHLFGYDHENEKDANKMESLEVKILDSLGIENPYKEELIEMSSI